MKKGPGKITGYAMNHLFKKPATIAYPYGKLELEKNYRGRIEYHAESCIGCKLCERDCPASAIKIVNVGTKEEKVFELHLDYGHCIFCAQCVDSCRKGCLTFSQNIELAGLDKDQMKVVLK